MQDRAFDSLTRELIFEAKAVPGERSATAEELAQREAKRLEALEAARLRRMQVGGWVGWYLFSYVKKEGTLLRKRPTLVCR